MNSETPEAFTPAYLALLESGELETRARQFEAELTCCRVCPWECAVDRRENDRGVCRTGRQARVSNHGPHLGEESPLVGINGSGTIFFARCNLKCQFCQNHDISQCDAGDETDADRLANMMLRLQALGCHNINFVSPTHVIPQIVAAVFVAARRGLSLPLVYNTGGYDSVRTLERLDGIFDIYMPDMKYADAEIAERLSAAPRYPETNRAAVKEMWRQVGDLETDERGVALRGLIVRHLVLPAGLSGPAEICRFLATEISPNTYLNLMDQYRPAYRAAGIPELSRALQTKDYDAALEAAREAGLNRLDRPRRRGWPF